MNECQKCKKFLKEQTYNKTCEEHICSECGDIIFLTFGKGKTKITTIRREEDKKTYNRYCLFCHGLVGWSYQSLTSDEKLEVCSGLCLQKLNEKLNKQLVERAESRGQMLKKTSQRMREYEKLGFESRREYIILKEKEYQNLLVNIIQELEKKESGQSSISHRIYQVLERAEKNNRRGGFA